MAMRYVIPGLVFAALLALLWVGLGLNPRELSSPLVGRPVPIFDLPELRDPGRRIGSADLKGKVTLLNVWASWCVSCRAEHALLVGLRQHGVRIIGLNYKDERADALGYLTAGGNPYEAVAFDYDGDVGIEWGVYGTPETFVIDKRGMIRYKHVGPLRAEVVKETILPLLATLEDEQP